MIYRQTFAQKKFNNQNSRPTLSEENAKKMEKMRKRHLLKRSVEMIKCVNVDRFTKRRSYEIDNDEETAHNEAYGLKIVTVCFRQRSTGIKVLIIFSQYSCSVLAFKFSYSFGKTFFFPNRLNIMPNT